MRTKKLFGMKKVMRTMALGLAAMLVAGSLNVMEVEAAPLQAPGASANATYPYYDVASGKYVYPQSDIFGAATHVHLFGETVYSEGHTHGNIVADTVHITNSGMRPGKIAYPDDYKEFTYVGTTVVKMESPVTGNFVHGSGVDVNSYINDGEIKKITLKLQDGSSSGLIQVEKGDVYESDVAVNIQEELAYLSKLSKAWGEESNTTGTGFDTNTRTITTAQATQTDKNKNVYINIPYGQWTATNLDGLTITGIDSDINNRGIVVINIDAGKDAAGNILAAPLDEINLTYIGLGIVVKTPTTTFASGEHSSSAFGTCRLVYNIIDSTQSDKVYHGKVTFSNEMFGSILAPGADVTVGAINGNVMAKTVRHQGNESHRLDVFPLFAKTDGSVDSGKIGSEDIALRLTLEGITSKTDFDGTTTPIESKTTYNLHADDNGKPGTKLTVAGNEAANKAFNDISADWVERLVWDGSNQKYVDQGTYEIEIGSNYVTQYLPAGNYWLVKDDISTGYESNNDVFKVIIAGDGTVTYAKGTMDGSGSVTGLTSPQRDIMTDHLIKSTTPVTIENIVLNLDLKGDDAQESGFSDGRDSETAYQLYTDKDCTIPVAGKGGAATWVGDTYQITIPGSGLNTNTTYYLKKNAITTNYKDNKTIYEVYVEPTGNILYRVTDTGTFTGSRQQGPMTDVLVLPNGPAKLNVVFSNPDNTAPTGDVTYKIYTEADKNKAVEGSESKVVSNGTSGTVTFGETITDKLEQDTVYYIGISSNGSDHKDEVDTFYQVKFDPATGNALYSNSGAWNTTPYTDKLIKNEEIKLNAKVDGDTSGSSNVTYDIYDANGNKIMNNPVPGTDANKDSIYEVVVDSTITTDKLERGDKGYYIALSTKPNDYTDDVEDKYYVKFDENGKAQYSTDKNTWKEGPLEDLLVKAKDTSSEPTSQPANPPAGDSGSTGGTTNDGGSTSGIPENGGNGSNSGSAGSSTPETNNGGASNNAGNNTAGDNTNKGTTDGASDANATDSALTGSNAMDSAKTGELKTIYIFAGFASVIAIAAGVYVFIKRKRA